MPEESNKNEFVKNFATYQERRDALHSKMQKGGTVLPPAIQQGINFRLDNLNTVFRYIEQSIEKINTSLLDNINQLLLGICSEIKYCIDNFDNTSVDSLIIRLTDFSSLAQSIKLNIQNTSSIQTIELESILSKYANTVKEIEVNANALDFKHTSIQYKNEAKWWLVGIFCILTILFGVIIWFMYNVWFDGKIFTEFKNATVGFSNADQSFKIVLFYEIFKKTFIRVLLIMVIIYFLKFAINNYSACAHNKIVNQHKANTLDAAIRILNLTKADDEIRNSILGWASKEIYSHHSTGFLKNEDKMNLSVLEKCISLLKKSGHSE